MTVTTYTSESPPSKILAHLQRNNDATVRDLEVLLGISTTAVREHLTHLEARGLIGTRLVRKGPGRPRLVYSLLPRAQELFPKEYGTLVILLMRELVNQGHSEQLQALLNAIGARLASEYSIQIGTGPIEERLNRLQVMLHERGIPADVDVDTVGLQMYACPYHAVAQEYPLICDMEREMLQQVLGETIQLNGSIREGQRSCHFVIDQTGSPPANDHMHTNRLSSQ